MIWGVPGVELMDQAAERRGRPLGLSAKRERRVAASTPRFISVFISDRVTEQEVMRRNFDTPQKRSEVSKPHFSTLVFRQLSL